MQLVKFLIEIGTEELPPKRSPSILEDWVSHLKDVFEAQGITYEAIKTYLTPRRMAIQVDGLPSKKPDYDMEKRGPALDRAYDQAGEPTKALLGFVKSCGCEVSDLQTIDTPKGKWLVWKKLIPGETIEVILPQCIEISIKRLQIPRTMRWGNQTHHFIRPVHWILALMNDKVLDFELFGLKAGRESLGHRFMSSSPINIEHADVYEQALKDAYVIANIEKRQALITQQIQSITEENTLIAVINEDLLQEVTQLVEFPVALLGQFDKDFLNLPREVLISTMEYHQKCFACKDKQGKLAPNFIAISNIQSNEPLSVVRGNERVMSARLSDAQFFFEKDKTKSIEIYLEKLKSVAFHEKLGSMYEKTKRLEALSQKIAKLLDSDIESAKRIAQLSKLDLCTDMVGEFPELQGTMGRYYAEHFGESKSIALAVEEHYMPTASHQPLPETTLGMVAALSDKLDNLTSYFSVGIRPSGVKDPYSLRRQALGIVRICVEKHQDISIHSCIQHAVESFSEANKSLVGEIYDYILERFKGYLAEKGHRPDVISAVLKTQPDHFRDACMRIEALSMVIEEADLQALSAANKRVSKLLRKHPDIDGKYDISLAEVEPEKKLMEALDLIKNSVNTSTKQQDYVSVIKHLSKLRVPIDDFFDQVMVMVEDEALRDNRLGLLRALNACFMQLADISLLQLEGEKCN